MICVFDAGNTNYTGNGDAVLQPKECKVKNIAGGNYDLTMTHPIDAAGKWTHLKPGAVIRVPVPREEIENAYAGEDVDVYKTTAEAALREGPSEPTTINYPGWSQYNTYSPGSKVSSGGKNYECTYFDQNSPMRAQSPGASSWWREIARTTSGAAALVTLPAGTDLYWIEDYDSTWAKLSTFYGIVGYIKKAQIQYDRHLDPEETQPRIITTQLFRLEKPTVDTKSHTVSVNAKHVSYDLNGVLVRDVKISQASPAMALGRITAGFMMDYAGTIATNLKASENGTYTQDIKGKSGMFALLDPDKGIVSTFNAAFRRDNWDLFIMKRVDTDRGYRIKYRKNMLGVNWAEDSSGLVTRVVPVAKDEKGEDLYLPETWIDSSRIGDYPVVKMERLTVKGQVGKDKGLGDDSKWTLEDLLDEMRTKARERFTVDMADRVNSTVTVDFEQIGDTEEYKEYKNLGTVLLYDTVRVENDEISLGMNLYVSEWEWDAIREKMLAVKLVNTTKYAKGTVTGYNVQAKSIGSDKLSDDVTGEIMRQVEDIIPEYTDPAAARPGVVTVTDSDPTLSWGTRSKVGEVSGTGLHVTMPGNPLESLDTDSTTPTDSDYTIKVGSPSKKITFAKVWAYIKSKLGISGSGSTAKYLDQQGNWTEPPGAYSLPTASSSTKGGIKTGYTQSGKNYPVQMSGENAYVNVPWTDTQYSLPLAGNGTRGGVQTGYTQNGRNYPVQLYNEKMYVNVPWKNDYIIFGQTGYGARYAVFARIPKTNPSGMYNGVYLVTGADNYGGQRPSAFIVTISNRGSVATMTAVSLVDGYNDVVKFGWYTSGDYFYFGVYSANYRNQMTVEELQNGNVEFAWFLDSTTAPSGWTDKYPSQMLQSDNYSAWAAKKTEAIKSITRNGTTFTATRCDDTTFTFTQQDNDHYAWGDITSKPDTATRWPAWGEVTGKPDTATRWPTWGEVTSKPVSYSYIGGSGDVWCKLGTFTATQAGSLWIHVVTGTGYNGIAGQNCIMDIYVRESNQGSGTTPVRSNFFAVTVYKYRVTSAEVRVIATAWNVAEVWIHFPSWYFAGFYSAETLYTWSHSGANSGSAPSGVAQNLENINITDAIKSITRSGSTFTATRLNTDTFTFTGVGATDYGSFSQAVGRITIPAGTQMLFAVFGANSNDNGLYMVTVNSSGTSTALVQIYKGSNLNVSVSGNVLSISMNNSNTAHAYGLLLKE